MASAAWPIDLIPAEPLADQFQRRIHYLRISVTDKCNLRCTYCMPPQGLPWIPNSALLSALEIERLVRVAASMGVRAVRITGGEPLVRPDVAEIVERVARIAGVRDVALSTNGLLLRSRLPQLCAAGLTRVNISLDTLRPERFKQIARREGLAEVLAAIDAALESKLHPVKINCVVMRGTNDDEVEEFAELTRARNVSVRFIELMPVSENAGGHADAYRSSAWILERLRQRTGLTAVEGPPGSGPARYFALPGAQGTVGVISPFSHDYCERCNRVRLTADGRLRLCLFGDHEIDFARPLRSGASDEALAALFRDAMLIKPERHHLRIGEASGRMRAFSEIGG